MPVEASPKQHRQELHRALRGRASHQYLVAPRPMVRDQRVDPRVQTKERKVVRRQNQGFRWDLLAQFVERFQIERQWIAVRLVRLDTDVGRDLGQYLVAGDQYLGLGAIEAGE